MKNDIIRTAIKHTIFEVCIDLFFNSIKKNFPKKGKRVPAIGEKYRKIIDKSSDYAEIYYACTVINPKDMGDYYDELDNSEKKSLVFSIKYERLEYNSDVIDEGDYQYFSQDEFNYLKFEK